MFFFSPLFCGILVYFFCYSSYVDSENGQANRILLTEKQTQIVIFVFYLRLGVLGGW